MSKTTSLICKNCGETTLHTKKEVNHILHFLLSIVTGGLWLIVWAILIFSNTDAAWKCSNCGKAASGAGWGIFGTLFRQYDQSKLKQKTAQLEQQEKYANKKCPYCAETIKAEAVVCRYCGKELDIYPSFYNK